MQGPYRVAVLPGDGIGPEVTAQALKTLKAVDEVLGVTFRLQNGLIGGCAVDATAVPLPAETIAICNNAHAILLEIGRDTSELQSLRHLVCRLLLEKKKL